MVRYDKNGHVDRTIRNYKNVDDPTKPVADCSSEDKINFDVTHKLNDPDPDPDHNITTDMVYGSNWQLKSTKDTLGNITTITPDPATTLPLSITHTTSSKDPLRMAGQAASIQYAYDSNHNVYQITDANQSKTLICYDILNRPWRRVQNASVDLAYGTACSPARPTSTAPDVNVTTDVTYNVNNQPTDITDPLGHITHIDYDGRQLQKQITQNYVTAVTGHGPNNDQNLSTQFLYDVPGNLETQIDASGNTTVQCYNKANQVFRQVVNPTALANNGQSSQPDLTTVCGYGYLRPASNPDQDQITSYNYDSAGRLVDTLQLLNPAGSAPTWYGTQNIYYATGWVKFQTNGYFQTDTNYTNPTLLSTVSETHTVYDKAGRPTNVSKTINQTGDRDPIHYDYTSLDQVSTITENHGGSSGLNDGDLTTSMTYDGLGRVISQTAPNQAGKQPPLMTKYHYDDATGDVQITDPLQHVSHAYYDVMGKLSSVSDGNNNATSYGYDGLYRQNLVKTSLTSASTIYDPLGNVTDVIDGNQVRKHLDYDGMNRVQDVIENCVWINSTCSGSSTAGPDNVKTSYLYDVLGNLKTVTPPQGGTTTYGYDRMNRQTSTSVQGVSSDMTWGTAYDRLGRIVDAVDPNKSHITTAYDFTNGFNRTTTTYTPGNGQVQATAPTATYVDGYGRLDHITDGWGTTTYAYDAVDRLHTIKDPAGNTVTYDHDVDGNLSKLTMPGKAPIQYSYYPNDQLQQVTDWQNLYTKYVYDSAGRLQNETLPNYVTAHFGYDADNRLGSITYKQSGLLTAEFDYTDLDKVGNRTQVTELLKNITAPPTGTTTPTPAASATPTATNAITPTVGGTPSLTSTDRMTFASQRNGQWEIYARDSNGTVNQLTYDTGGAMSPAWSPDGSKLAYMAWEQQVGTQPGTPNGRWHIRVKDANGKDLNNLDLTANDTADDTAPAWSPDGSQIAFTSRRDGNANIYTMNADGSNPTRLTHNSADNTSATWSPDGSKIAYASNQSGNWNIWLMNHDGSNPAQLTSDATAPNTSPAWSPDGSKIAFTSTQNSNAELYTIAPTVGATPTLIPGATSANLDLQPAWSSNSSRIAFRSNRKMWPASDANYDIFAVNTDGSNLAQLTTNNNNNDSPNWTTATQPVTSDMTKRTIGYTYDKLYRLTDASYADNGTATTDYSYQYDRAGNRTTTGVQQNGHTAFTDYYYDAANRLTCSAPGNGHTATDCSAISDPAKHSYNFDLAGNLLNEQANGATFNSYKFDVANQLVNVNNTTQYAYNGMGDRYSKTVNGTTTNYLLDQAASLTQVLSQTTNNSTTTYLEGIGEQKQDGTWSYYNQDGLGSVRQLTDSSGNTTYRADYDPYGSPLTSIDSSKTSAGFTGEQTDDNGLVYLRARYYNATTGTFLSHDPFGGTLTSNATQNGYGYVGGNPVNNTDHSGKCIGPLVILCGAIAGAVVGAVFGGIVGGGLDFVGQTIYIAQHGGNYNPGQMLQAAAVGAVGGAVGGAVVGSGGALAGLMGITAATSGAATAGAFTIGVSGIVGGQASTVASNLLSGQNPLNDYWNFGRMAFSFGSAIVGSAVIGYAWNQITDSNVNPFTAFFKQSFVNSMSPEDAVRYRQYWDSISNGDDSVTNPDTSEPDTRIRANRRTNDDPGASLRVRRSWFAQGVFKDVFITNANGKTLAEFDIIDTLNGKFTENKTGFELADIQKWVQDKIIDQTEGQIKALQTGAKTAPNGQPHPVPLLTDMQNIKVFEFNVRNASYDMVTEIEKAVGYLQSTYQSQGYEFKFPYTFR